MRYPLDRIKRPYVVIGLTDTIFFKKGQELRRFETEEEARDAYAFYLSNNLVKIQHIKEE